MIQTASVEVNGNEVTITVIASSPEEAQKIARNATIKLETAGVEIAVVEREDGK